MSPLASSQAKFASAVFDPALPVPGDLRSLGAAAGEDRFAVYRNNVMVGLIGGLRDAYPVVCRLVGDEFFRAMAGVFARAHPPRSPVMLQYGGGFANFIATFPPVSGLPYLADVARLERAWVESYHAPEAQPLASLPSADGVRARLHPAARLVRSPFPILAIWQANQHDNPIPLELSPDGDNVLVTRPAAEVRACRIADEAAASVATQSFVESPHFETLLALGAFTTEETCR